ncbi:exonuclease domain-containing protein [Demequina sp. SYSU T00192]|uniref:Exonuclease domain-containing protein n=1 Tax=Demequina litoralis TaxID=3051660 RepID=A0ABT8G9I5_9MICO|nr:exonuclease domain-containing protein [Demequina sp. SYSU T00192]MDN4475799.1 exonuclease domain-containing protein [Demequina sp. SYSU T00192]
MSGYAVIDLETTGFAYKSLDRICEIAVVLLDADGRREDAYSTLVNPLRDLGAQHVHGIDATDTRVAPTFDRIVGDLTELLGGRTVVAHNAPFDVRFLAAEYARAGVPIALTPDDAVCTMKLAREVGVPSKLGDACQHFGIPLDGAHAALVDAEATAQLLARYREFASVERRWHQLATAGERLTWPAAAPLATSVVHRGATRPGNGLLESVVAAFDGASHHRGESAYLDLLGRVLLDRKITAQEKVALDSEAAHHRLSAADRERLHRTYMLGVVDAACDDDLLTADERAHIVQMANLLGLADLEVEALLAHATSRVATVSTSLDLTPGALVVFTGHAAADKARLSSIAESRGLVVWPGVKKGVAAVIAKDPGSNSGKAKKARDLGIPVVGSDALG